MSEKKTIRRKYGLILLIPFLCLMFAGFATNLGAKTTLRFWIGGFPVKAIALLKENITLFEKENPDIEVEFATFPWVTYRQKLGTSIAAGMVPDLFVDAFVKRYADMGGLTPITDLFNSLPFKDQFSKGVIDACSVGGEIMGVPHNGWAMLLGMNKDLYRKVGLDPNVGPKTWEELLEQEEQLTVEGQWGVGLLGGRLCSHYFSALMFANGIKVSTNGELTIGDYRPELYEVMQFMYDQAEYSPGGPKIAAGNGYSEVTQMFAQEEVAILWTGALSLRNQMADMNPSLELGFFTMPRKKTGDSMMGGDNIMLGKTQNVDAAWKLATFLLDIPITVPFCLAATYVPMRLDAASHPMIQDDFAALAALKQIDQGVQMQPMADIASWGELREKVFDAVALSLLGRRTIEQAMDDMVEQMEKIQKEWQATH